MYRRVYGRELEVADVSLVSDVANDEPLVFALRAPSPSPAKNGAVLRFEVPEAVPVTLEMFDVAGRLVRSIANGQRFEPGRYGIAIRKGAFPPGLYLVRFRAGSFEQVQRLVILG